MSEQQSVRIERRQYRKRFGCRPLPHGCYPIFPMILSILGWIASVVEDGCSYARVTGPIVQSVTGSSDVPFLEFGFNSYRRPIYNSDNESWKTSLDLACLQYDESLIKRDTFWTVGEAFAFVSLVLGGGGALFLCLTTCFVFSPGTWRWTGYEIMTAAIFQALCFIWFHTKVCAENSCALVYGSITDIIAAFLWLISGLAILTKYPLPVQKANNTVNMNESRHIQRNQNKSANQRNNTSNNEITNQLELSNMENNFETEELEKSIEEGPDIV